MVMSSNLNAGVRTKDSKKRPTPVEWEASTLLCHKLQKRPSLNSPEHGNLSGFGATHDHRASGGKEEA
eukprot:1146997-Pelagomonas_calceolata.AAC.3